MADRVGQQLGSYLLTRLLGSGGFAEVYLGEHLRLKTLAAIKVLHARLAGEDVGGFLNEAQTIARLEHPNIVRVFDYDVQDGTAFLVMSYAANGTLRQRHPKGIPLPLPTIVSYLKQVSDALQYAHEEKLIHRDVKPENMLLGRRNEVLLSDFGIALMAQSSRFQSTQEVAGTAHYMAPEQLQGKPRLASDQYSLGVVVYEWICGSRPFQGSFSEIASQHVLTPPPPLRERMPGLPPEIEQVVFTTLAKDPHQRFGSIRAFATAFEQASQSSPGFIIGNVPPPPPSSPLQQGPVTPLSLPPVQPDRIISTGQPPTLPTSPSFTPQLPVTPPNMPTPGPFAPPNQSFARNAGSGPSGPAGRAPQPGILRGRLWEYVLGAYIVLVMGFVLFIGVSPELSEVPEVPNTTSDVARYECYAVVFWQGVPGLNALPFNQFGQCAFLADVNNGSLQQFHTLPQEYPFLSLLPFSLVFTAPLAWYQITFAVWMALVAGVIYFVLQRYRSLQAAIAFALYLVLGSWATAEGRFDLVPAALTLGTVILAARARWRWAFSLLAVATLLKFYAVVLVPPLLVAQQIQYGDLWTSRQRWRDFGAFVGICIGGTLLSLLLSVQGTISPFLYFINRPVQVESLPASLLWLGHFLGVPYQIDLSFQSFNFLSPLSLPITLLSTLCLVGGVIYVCWLQRRGNMDIYMASLLILSLVLITDKVFSSQYFIWVIPFVAYIGRCNWRWLLSWGGVALLTTIIFPYIYSSFFAVIRFYPVIFLRNGLLLAIICVLLYRAARSQYRTA